MKLMQKFMMQSLKVFKIVFHNMSENAYPSPLLYKNFPKSVCTSVNEIVCHGIPDSRPLKATDIINVDITVYIGA